MSGIGGRGSGGGDGGMVAFWGIPPFVSPVADLVDRDGGSKSIMGLTVNQEVNFIVYLTGGAECTNSVFR